MNKILKLIIDDYQNQKPSAEYQLALHRFCDAETVEQIKFPLEKRSPKYFINCFHIASGRLGKKVLAKDLPNLFVIRLNMYKTAKVQTANHAHSINHIK